jgi:rhodanese-related sulfurtransferase
MPAFNSISTEKLARRIGTPDCPLIIDVRSPEDLQADRRVIPTSQLKPFATLEAWSAGLAGKPVVVACNRGLKLSEGVAALLRLRGVAAEVLEGGFVGWKAAGLPLVPLDLLPSPDDHAGSLWVTRHRPKIDRIACPWLIRRFVDPGARFMFVAPSEVMSVAEIFGATPFDVADTFFSHRDDQCSFDTMVKEFHLSFPALERLATIVRAADTDRAELAPEAKGLLAISLGLSRIYSDDLAQMEAGMLIYDCLYRFVRDASDETHDWISHVPKGKSK